MDSSVLFFVFLTRSIFLFSMNKRELTFLTLEDNGALKNKKKTLY